jgi:anti-anti-sigma factor
MNKNPPRAAEQVHYQCPVCGQALHVEPSLPRFDAPCSGCGFHIWCRRRVANGEAILEVLPQRTPEPQDVTLVVESVARSNAAPCVVVDLAQLDTVDSAFVARLVSMNKQIRGAGGRLILSGLRPVVREVFKTLRLDRAFEIEDRVAAAAQPA